MTIAFGESAIVVAQEKTSAPWELVPGRERNGSRLNDPGLLLINRLPMRVCLGQLPLFVTLVPNLLRIDILVRQEQQ